MSFTFVEISANKTSWNTNSGGKPCGKKCANNGSWCSRLSHQLVRQQDGNNYFNTSGNGSI